MEVGWVEIGGWEVGETNSLDLLLQLIVLLGGLLGLSTGLLRVELGEALLVFWVRIGDVDAFVGIESVAMMA